MMRWLRTLRCVASCSSASWLASSLPARNVPPSVHLRQLSASAKPPQRTEVLLQETDLRESFVKGSGKGGQKINKVRNCVLLTHLPSGLQVRCQKTRSLDGNRRAARKLLLHKLDDHVNGALSKRSEKIDRLRRKKASRRAKAKHKYAKTEERQEEEDDEEDDEEEEGEEDDLSDWEQHRRETNQK